MLLVVRLKEGPCPEEAFCVTIGKLAPRRDVVIPDGDYLVVMSPAVAQAVNIEEVRRRFKCVICVGPSTARAVGSCVTPREYSSYGVAKLLEAMSPGRVVVLRSGAGNDVLRRLVPGVVEVSVYDVVIDEDAVKSLKELAERASAIVATSSLVAEVLAKSVDLRGKKVVAIGPVTSDRLNALGVPHVVAPEATIEAAVETARRMLAEGGRA
ncbi:MAG: uroporphyrinogen-III synthase [Pyrobaculum sp.]